MCVGIPETVVSCEGLVGLTATGRRIDLMLTGPVAPGTHVLTHLGCAREIIDAQEAALIAAALDGLDRIMQGGDLGDAFADLEARAPALPPHLEAARAAGKTTG